MNTFFATFANNNPAALIAIAIVGVIVVALAVVGGLYAFANMSPRARRNTILIIIVILIAISSAACGGGTDDSNPAVGETLVGDALNAAANADGDGEANTAPCPGIVC